MFALLLALGQAPCLPAEFGRHHVEDPAVTLTPAPPPPAPAPPAPPRPASLPGPLQQHERARFRVGYGLFGTVGEITLESLPGAPPPPSGPATVQLTGRASGSILGIGYTQKSFDTDFDARTLAPLRWKHHRAQGDKVVTDFTQQNVPGTVTLARQRPGQPVTNEALARKAPVLDPLAFLARLRIAPPTSAPQTFEVLDGRALWLITVNPAVPVSLAGGAKGGTAASPVPLDRALRLDGEAQPIYWDGDPDTDRQARTFSIWLADDLFHTPVRLTMPLAVGEVRVDLVSLSRARPRGVRGFPPLSMRAISRWLTAIATNVRTGPAPRP